MTARRCFRGKIAAGRVSPRAGTQILDMLDDFERAHQRTLGDGAGARQAALDTAAAMQAKAAQAADQARGAAIAQSGVLRAFQVYDARVGELRATPGDFGFGNQAPPFLKGETASTLYAAVRSLLARDPWEIATGWNNVHYLAKDIRAEAQRKFADAIEALRPKFLGLKPETARELDVLRAVYGETAGAPRTALDGAPAADVTAHARAWAGIAEDLRQQFVDAGGVLPARENWRLPNPDIDEAKVRALGADRFKALVRAHNSRADMLDFDTGLPLTDARYEQLLDDVWQGFASGFVEGPPSGAPRGRRMLANSRDHARFFVWKDAESWLAIAEAIGTHASPYETMLGHIRHMAQDIAMMRVLGPNPEATKRFILDLFDREAARLAVTAPAGANAGELAAAARANNKTEARIRSDRKLFENLWAEVSNANDVPVNIGFAGAMSDMRSLLAGAQLGTALISSISDTGTVAMTSRMNGLPVANVINRATQMMAEEGSEIFAAQMGLTADTIASQIGHVDRMMGEEIRNNAVAKVGAAAVRASGLRRWTAVMRNAFGLELQAHVARERGKAFGELEPQFRQALERYGIGEPDWELIRSVDPLEPQPNALYVRAADVAAGGTAAHRAAADKLARMTHTEMDYAVIDHDPVTRAVLLGDSRPGTIAGEARRAASLYKTFGASFIALHFARAFARGWNGERLAHGALTFMAMTALGVVAMQSKEILAGRDPLNLDPSSGKGLRAWGKAMLQGGGFGVFGDVLFLDQTKYGNTWAAAFAGPQFAAAETIVGDFVIRNAQRAAKGEQTHFAGDAFYVGARYLPGSSLWFGRLAFQRAVLDQAALMIDERTPERFRRLEQTARKEFGQDYWWQPGRVEPRRAPDFMAIGSAR